jgi:hypothetical protein
MEPEGLLPCSQERATCPYPELDQSSNPAINPAQQTKYWKILQSTQHSIKTRTTVNKYWRKSNNEYAYTEILTVYSVCLTGAFGREN